MDAVSEKELSLKGSYSLEDSSNLALETLKDRINDNLPIDEVTINNIALFHAPRSVSECIDAITENHELLLFDAADGTLLYDVIRATIFHRIRVRLYSQVQSLSTEKQAERIKVASKSDVQRFAKTKRK